MSINKEYSLVNDLGFLKTGVSKFHNTKKYYATGSIKGETFSPEGEYNYDNRPSRANRDVKEGDVLQARMMNTNKVILIDKKLDGSLFSTGFFQFRPPKELVIPKFLYYFLSSKFFLDKKNSLCGGATQKAINDANLKKIKIFLPSLPEQQRIVAKLDTVFAEIDKPIATTEKNTVNLKLALGEIISKKIKEISLKAEMKNLGDIAEFKNGINFRKSLNGTPVKILGVGDFQSNFYAPCDCFETVLLDGDIRIDDEIMDGDIVFVRSNGNKELIGRSMLVRNLQHKTTFSGFTIRARLNNKELLPEFVTHILKSENVRRQLIEGGNGLNISSLNQNLLSVIEIPILDLREQQDWVRIFEKIEDSRDNLKSISFKKLQNLEALKSAILTQELQSGAA